MKASPDDDVLVSVNGISKKFSRSMQLSLSYGVRDIFRELTGTPRRSWELRDGEFWALKDVSFVVRRGTGVGLIGPNGSGKTTLLRLLSGLIKPDEGEIRIRGRVAPLIALGAGFNPVLSGRENVYTNMAMLGLTHGEIVTRFDDVLNFAEIGDAIDAPLQTYSSGMAARLGFACAIHTTPDVLLVDEVLSVGDMRFRAKCYRKLAELRENGVAFILVSHSLNAILSMTNNAIYLRGGREVVAGDPVQVVMQYEQDMAAISTLPVARSPAAEAASKENDLRITEVTFTSPNGKLLKQLVSGQPARLLIKYIAKRPIQDLVVTVLIRELSEDMRLLLNINSGRDGSTLRVERGRGSIALDFPAVTLGPGLYTAKIALGNLVFYIFDAVEEHRFLVTADNNMSQCAFYQPRAWQVFSDPNEQFASTIDATQRNPSA
jgi:lipopolysaccharide transport system ATP-binding protein